MDHDSYDWPWSMLHIIRKFDATAPKISDNFFFLFRLTWNRIRCDDLKEKAAEIHKSYMLEMVISFASSHAPNHELWQTKIGVTTTTITRLFLNRIHKHYNVVYNGCVRLCLYAFDCACLYGKNLFSVNSSQVADVRLRYFCFLFVVVLSISFLSITRYSFVSFFVLFTSTAHRTVNYTVSF